jgi:RNA polymerase sigma factor (sigma-70 family)
MYLRRSQQRARIAQTHLFHEDGLSLEEIAPSFPANLDDRVLLRQMVSILKPRYRTVVILHDLKGYKHDEIARILNIPSGTSKSNLYRARHQIRKVFRARASRQLTPSRAA